MKKLVKALKDFETKIEEDFEKDKIELITEITSILEGGEIINQHLRFKELFTKFATYLESAEFMATDLKKAIEKNGFNINPDAVMEIFQYMHEKGASFNEALNLINKKYNSSITEKDIKTLKSYSFRDKQKKEKYYKIFITIKKLMVEEFSKNITPS